MLNLSHPLLDLTVAITHWPITAKRFSYLQQTLESISKDIKDWPQYPIRTLSIDVDEDTPSHLIQAATSLGKSNGFETTTHNRSWIGQHLNHIREKCSTKYLFLLQDDWTLRHPIYLSHCMDFLVNHPSCLYLRFLEGGAKQYTHPIDNLTEIRRLDPVRSWYYYSDNPHIQNHARMRELIGEYPETPPHDNSWEGAYNGKCKQVKEDLGQLFNFAVTTNNFFQHIGHETTL